MFLKFCRDTFREKWKDKNLISFPGLCARSTCASFATAISIEIVRVQRLVNVQIGEIGELINCSLRIAVCSLLTAWTFALRNSLNGTRIDFAALNVESRTLHAPLHCQ